MTYNGLVIWKMRRFNPYQQNYNAPMFNQNYQIMNYNYPQYSRSPFDIPKLRSPVGSSKRLNLFSGAKKLNLTGLIDTSSKAINTFNQMIPIYQEIKPVFTNTRSALSTLKRAFIKPKKDNKKQTKPIEPEVLDKAVVNLKANKQNYKEEIKPDNEPHKPYF